MTLALDNAIINYKLKQNSSEVNEMSRLYKEYFSVEGRNEEVKAEVGYELGGHNYYSGQNNRRGYYLYINSVERKESNGYSTESFTLFDGFKVVLVEATRQSKGKEQLAIAEGKNVMSQYVQRYLNEKGWKLKESI